MIAVLGRIFPALFFVSASSAQGRQFGPGHCQTKNAGLPPQSDHTCFTRLPTSTMYDSLAPGTARQKMPDYHRGSTTRVLLDCRQAICATVWLRALPGKEMTPDFSSGVISFPWVRSLGNLAFYWIDRAVLVWWESLPQHSCSSALVRDWHLCKTEDNERPAGRCTYHIRYHLFSYHQSTTVQALLQDGISNK